MTAVLEKISLKSRTGETLVETYGRRVRQTAETGGDDLANYAEAADQYDVPWSSAVASAVAKVAFADVGQPAVSYAVDGTERRDQRTLRVRLGGVR